MISLPKRKGIAQTLIEERDERIGRQVEEDDEEEEASDDEEWRAWYTSLSLIDYKILKET